MIEEASIRGLPNRRVDGLVQARQMTGTSRSQESGLCKGIDVRMNFFIERPITGEWTHLWLDATYLGARGDERIVAAITASRVNTDGRCESSGVGPSGAAVLLLGFLFCLEERGLRGCKLVISDAQRGFEHRYREGRRSSVVTVSGSSHA